LSTGGGMWNKLLLGGIVLVILLAGPAWSSTAQSDSFANYAKIAMPFLGEADSGLDSRMMRFSARTFFGAVQVDQIGTISYALPFSDRQSGKPRYLVLQEGLVNKQNSLVIGEERSAIPVHSFSGQHLQPGGKESAVFESVSLGEVYTGIHVSLKATGNSVEKIFRIEPGASWSSIRIKVSGGQAIRLGKGGELEVETAMGAVAFAAPVAFQEMEGGLHRSVAVSYTLIHPLEAVYGFTVGEYDPNRELIIDPILMAACFGNAEVPNFDMPLTSLGVDGEGSVFIAGVTSAADFPVTAGAFGGSFNGGNSDIFVVKLDNNLQKLLAATFIGGEGGELCKALLVDRQGFVYLSGSTSSNSFPVTPRAFQAKLSGLQKAFILKLDNNLSNLLASSLFVEGMASVMTAGGNDEIYIGGSTSQEIPELSVRNPEILVTKYRGGEWDGFVAKIDHNLEQLMAMTLLGGKGMDVVTALTTDKTDVVYVTGFTSSTDFPMSKGAYDTSHNGEQDVFVAKLDGRLLKPLAATYLGGKGVEISYAIVLDASGFLYVAGRTGSRDFPVFEKSFDYTYNGGESDLFVVKFNADLTSLTASTFLGGVGDDHVFSLLLDHEQRNLILVGDSDSKGFAGIIGAIFQEKSSSPHVYSLVLTNDLYMPRMSFFGGSAREACPVAVHGDGDSIIIAGSTSSRDFPTTPDGYRTAAGASIYQTFVAKIEALADNNRIK